MTLLTEDEIARALDTVPTWTRDGAEISRSVEAESFLAGLDLVTAVGRAAEDADHHPDIDIRWRTITFVLSTHSEGGLTERDFALARTIDGIVG
ncbi:MAG: 4a-hydroxytetrahydrobiopterin dehydratase [Marmoricola sp.]